MEDFFNSHFIRTNSNNLIVLGFSDAFQQPEPTDTLINAQGGYQFRLFPGGEENPPLIDEWGVPLFRWDGKAAQRRSSEEVEADRPSLLGMQPDPLSRITQLEEVIAGLTSALAASGTVRLGDMPMQLQEQIQGIANQIDTAQV